MRLKGFTLIELMVVIAIIGIVVSVAIPTYQNYMIRARVSEGLNLAIGAKLAVVETTISNNALPENQRETGYMTPAPTANVSSITIAKKGRVVIAYTASAGNGTLILAPKVQKNGEITWSCAEGTLAKKYRPANCRG